MPVISSASAVIIGAISSARIAKIKQKVEDTLKESQKTTAKVEDLDKNMDEGVTSIQVANHKAAERVAIVAQDLADRTAENVVLAAEKVATRVSEAAAKAAKEAIEAALRAKG